MNALKKLIHEVHRRSLWQVVSIYLMGSWGALQVVESVTQNAGLPNWVPPFALILLVIGLPITVATAFIQEGLPGRGDHSAPTESAPTAAAAGASAAPSPKRRLFTWRNAIMGGLGAVFLLFTTTMVYFVMWSAGIGPAGSLVAQGVLEERDPIILARFDNRSDDEMLGAVVTDALRVDLTESQVVTLVDDRLVKDALQRMGRPTDAPLTPGVARELAEREGIKTVVEGEVSRVGTGYLLAARLILPSDGSALAAFRETATGEDDLLPAIDRLSERLREKAGESLRTIRAGEPLEAVTTSSLPALRLFAQASQAEEGGDVQGTIDLLKEAVALDSTFAMAWRKLAVQYSNRGGDYAATVEAASAAYRHRNRLTQRERYLAEAYYAYTVTDDPEATAQAYRRVLEIQPDDPVALNNLGIYYADKKQWPEAATLYQRAVDGPGRSRSAYNNLVIARYNEGRKDDAAKVLDDWFARYPLEYGMVRHRFIVRWGMGDAGGAEAAARAGLDTLADVPFAQIDLRSRLADMKASQGKMAEARALQLERRAIAEAQRLALQAYYANQDLAWLDISEGKDTLASLRSMERHFDTDLASVPELNRPYGAVAFAWAVAGRDTARARLWYDRQNTASTEEHLRSAAHEADLLEQNALIQLAGGRWANALETYRELRRRNDNCQECNLRAFAIAFEGLQQPDSAIMYLERFEAMDEFDLVDDRETQLGDVLPQLARLYEQVGREEDAARAWTRFADRWADADATLQPRVRRAREAAARLSGS